MELLDTARGLVGEGVAKIVSMGGVPAHVGIIMDGNRRWAKGLGVERQEGHIAGFGSLQRTLDGAMSLGVEEVTVYAFSLENWKRSEEEVNGLMKLAQEKFEGILAHDAFGAMVDRYGIVVRIVGDMSGMPSGVVEAVRQVEARTAAGHSSDRRRVLNIAMGYTGRAEIAVGAARGGIEDGVDGIEKATWTGSRPVDLMIRTSGEIRLSDFLLWQARDAELYFTPVMWPDFGVWHMCKAVLWWQVQKALRRES